MQKFVNDNVRNIINSPKLVCLLFNDLEPWERSAIEPILQVLSRSISVEQIAVTESERRFFKQKRSGNYWVLSRNWYQALTFLSANQYRGGTIFTSVFHASTESRSLHTLFYKTLLPSLSEAIHLFVHSPLNQRFFCEIGNFPTSRLSLLPLALPEVNLPYDLRAEGEKLHVGTFGEFSTENNINYLLGVAHYVCHLNTNVNFRVLGRGPLYSHFVRMIHEMGLTERVSVVETMEAADIACLDLFLYTPLRNHHFIPVLCAAAYEIPVLSLEIPGIEKLINDGHSGFIVSVNEIKPMGELVLRMLQNAMVRTEMGKKLRRDLVTQYSLQQILELYQQEFLKLKHPMNQSLETAA